MKYFDGTIYDGEWRDDKRNGKGIMKDSEGKKYSGEWINDRKKKEDL